MPKKKRAVALTPDEQHELETFVAHGKKSAREITRARILLLAQDGRRQDNLNTHTPGAFYEVLPPAEAFALAQKFEPHYTPKKGSWLNMAEIEFAALSTQCLDRRLPEVATLRREVLVWTERRNQEGKTVTWKFSQDKARQKLHRHYQNVQKFT
jgi:hypothetical protein